MGNHCGVCLGLLLLRCWSSSRSGTLALPPHRPQLRRTVLTDPPANHLSLRARPFPPYSADLRSGDVAAQPPRMLQERLALPQAPGQRQLGYVVVTRPVRQGRLRLALEEVLSMQMDAPDCTAQLTTPCGDTAGTGVGVCVPAGAGAAGTAAAGCGADALSPSALLGLGSDGGSEGASSLGSRTSSCSNLRCAGATLVRATPSSTCFADAAAAGAPMRLLLAEDNMINMKVGSSWV